VDIQKVIAEGKFDELRELNLKRMGYDLPDLQKLSGLVLATRFDGKPKLYTCFPLGSVKERAWTAVGTGDVKIKEYMQALEVLSEAKNYLGKQNATLKDVLRVGLEAVRRAQSQDLYSHGLDMLVCTPEGIKDHFTLLGDDFELKLKRIQRCYS
jgi:20S proteasome alpha/beta subunit